MSENKVPEAMKILREALKDESYRISWQSNIAMSFQDTLHHAGYKLPDQHKISNDAANLFLSWLTMEPSNDK